MKSQTPLDDCGHEAAKPVLRVRCRNAPTERSNMRTEQGSSGGRKRRNTWVRLVQAALLAGAALFPGDTAAQDRTADNAVTQAEDAFGFSVGRESLGIYSASNARGFSPTAAGNLRIEGLYYNSVFSLVSTINESTSIKVGLAALGYPFAAPSGIVDQSIRRPIDRLAASIVVNADSFGTIGVEVDGSLPINDRLALGYGLTAEHMEYPDGTNDTINHGQALLLRWRPASGIEILPFWSLYNDYRNEAGTYFVPAGKFLPPQPPEAQYDGPSWSAFRTTGLNYGTLVSVAASKTWLLRLGAFRSVFDQLAGFTNLLENMQPDGTAERTIIADPRLKNSSNSGEFRVTHDVADGPRLHVVSLSIRGRDAHHQFGGSDAVDFGPAREGSTVEPPEPQFSFGPISRDHVQQLSYGIAYDGRWRNVGELSLSVSHTDYQKTTLLPGTDDATSRSHPWLYSGTLAVKVARALTAYTGYARGLEDSGVAPQNAVNRNAPLPALQTEQKDAGVRWDVVGNIKLVGGVFDLRKPYFGYDTGGTYTQVGSIRSRGAEVSLSGTLTKRLSVVAGGVFLDPRVERDPSAQGLIGSRPVGLPGRSVNLNANWSPPILRGLSFDISATERSSVPATTDNLVSLPPRTLVNLGARYRFRLSKHDATVRLQAYNTFDVQSLALPGPGIYGAYAVRYVSGYMAVDI